MENLNQLAMVVYKLRVARINLDRQSREFKKSEEKLIEQIDSILGKDMSRDEKNYRIERVVTGRFPAWKKILESIKGEEFIAQVIMETKPTMGIEVKPIGEIAKEETIVENADATLQLAKKMVG